MREKKISLCFAPISLYILSIYMSISVGDKWFIFQPIMLPSNLLILFIHLHISSYHDYRRSTKVRSVISLHLQKSQFSTVSQISMPHRMDEIRVEKKMIKNKEQNEQILDYIWFYEYHYMAIDWLRWLVCVFVCLCLKEIELKFHSHSSQTVAKQKFALECR